MEKTVVKDLAALKAEMQVKRDVIIIEGEIDECIDYFKKTKTANILGNIGIVAGIIAWPLLLAGVVEKVVNSSSPGYLYGVRKDRKNSFAINKKYVKNTVNNFEKEVNDFIKKHNIDCKVVENELGLKTHTISKLIKAGIMKYDENEKTWTKINRYFEKYSDGEESISEFHAFNKLFDELGYTNERVIK